jgi:hypothetical protein
MAKKTPRQQMWAKYLDGEPPKPRPYQQVSPFTRLVTLYVPKRLAAHRKENARAVLDEVNAKISERGYIEPDGQILQTPISPTVELQMIDLWGCDSEEQLSRMRGLAGTGDVAGIIVGETDDSMLEVEPRVWGPEQSRYFGRDNPYQLSEEPGEYSYWHVQLGHRSPYLAEDERIIALLHGGRDNAYVYCPCHEASVVYTTRHRFICMGCGFLHAVPEAPLSIHCKTLLSGDEWREYFEPGGSKSEEEVNLTLLDFQDIENTRMIWTTTQWEETRHRFLFFARSSPEEISEAIRGTEMDPSIFLNAGWEPVATAPPVAHQIADDSVAVDLIDNAMLSLGEGVRFYLTGKNESSSLVNAVPALFRAVELFLKERLERADPQALADLPNNPTVLKRLKAAGVAISTREESTITQLRRLRNNLQHGTAKFNQRSGLSVCRETLIFVARFLEAELNLYLGDGVHENDWFELLAIPEISATADRVTDATLDLVRQQKNATIETCPRCRRDAMVRPFPNTGMSCLYCLSRPVIEDDSPELG